MNDKELLEMAAKAAGAEYESSDQGEIEILSEIGGTSGDWDPLTDDGDALRLAAKLKFTVDFESCRVWSPGIACEILSFMEAGEIDMRRAIVRAAAEIGKSL